MRAVFFGTPRAAVPALEALLVSPHSVAAVVTRPDRAGRRGRALEPPPVKLVAVGAGLPVWQPASPGARSFREQVAEVDPEVLVVVAYGRLLGPKLLAVAPRGAVNVHFSLLPRWRGAAPVQRAILAGDERTGVTTMSLVPELDAGPVYLREEVRIGEDEHAGALEGRLARLGADLLVRTLDGLAAGELRPEPQDDAQATLAPPLEKEEGWLDPGLSAGELVRRVRAFDPWPGTRLVFPGGPVAVLSARAERLEGDAAPGTVLPPRGSDLPVACGDGSLLVLERVKPAGKREMPARSLVDGRVVSVGERATPPEACPRAGGTP